MSNVLSLYSLIPIHNHIHAKSCIIAPQLLERRSNQINIKQTHFQILCSSNLRPRCWLREAERKKCCKRTCRDVVDVCIGYGFRGTNHGKGGLSVVLSRGAASLPLVALNGGIQLAASRKVLLLAFVVI